MKNKSKKAQKSGSALAGEEGLDPRSAFVHMAVKNRADIPGTNGGQGTTPSTSNSSDHLLVRAVNDTESPLPPNVLEAQRLATRGNYIFATKQYKEAIVLFTDAIRLDPQEVRFLGNRAFCYEVLGDYDKALEDADTALSMAPTWAKGCYRKGCALEGLGRFEEAERAFEQVLRLDERCLDAGQARHRVRVKQLSRLGFSYEQSEAAILQYGSVKQAADSLLATRLLSSSALSEVFDSDDEEALMYDRWSTGKSSSCSSSGGSQLAKSTSPPVETPKGADPLSDPKNPLHWDTLWVGNLLAETSEKMLIEMFGKYGKLRQSHLMLEKHCAFLTYIDFKHAGDAMRDLQGKDILGQRILIKYPDRALEKSGAPQQHTAHKATLVLRKSSSNSQNGGRRKRK